MPFTIRSGIWLRKRHRFFEEDPDPTGFGRLEVIVAGPERCRVHKEASGAWQMMPTSLIQEWWRPLRIQRCKKDLPAWVQEGVEVTWNRWSYSGGREWVTKVPVQISRIRSTWFTTLGVLDGVLWFWDADYLAENPDLFSFNGPVPRFHRECVI